MTLRLGGTILTCFTGRWVINNGCWACGGSDGEVLVLALELGVQAGKCLWVLHVAGVISVIGAPKPRWSYSVVLPRTVSTKPMRFPYLSTWGQKCSRYSPSKMCVCFYGSVWRFEQISRSPAIPLAGLIIDDDWWFGGSLCIRNTVKTRLEDDLRHQEHGEDQGADGSFGTRCAEKEQDRLSFQGLGPSICNLPGSPLILVEEGSCVRSSGHLERSYDHSCIVVQQRGSVGAVARALASHHGGPGSIPGRFTPGFSHVGIVLDNAACWLVFSGYSHFPRPYIPAPLHPRVSFPVMSGDDRHLRVLARKPVTRSVLPRPGFTPYARRGRGRPGHTGIMNHCRIVALPTLTSNSAATIIYIEMEVGLVRCVWQDQKVLYATCDLYYMYPCLHTCHSDDCTAKKNGYMMSRPSGFVQFKFSYRTLFKWGLCQHILRALINHECPQFCQVSIGTNKVGTTVAIDVGTSTTIREKTMPEMPQWYNSFYITVMSWTGGNHIDACHIAAQHACAPYGRLCPMNELGRTRGVVTVAVYYSRADRVDSTYEPLPRENREESYKRHHRIAAPLLPRNTKPSEPRAEVVNLSPASTRGDKVYLAPRQPCDKTTPAGEDYHPPYPRKSHGALILDYIRRHRNASSESLLPRQLHRLFLTYILRRLPLHLLNRISRKTPQSRNRHRERRVLQRELRTQTMVSSNCEDAPSSTAPEFTPRPVSQIIQLDHQFELDAYQWILHVPTPNKDKNTSPPNMCTIRTASGKVVKINLPPETVSKLQTEQVKPAPQTVSPTLPPPPPPLFSYHLASLPWQATTAGILLIGNPIGAGWCESRDHTLQAVRLTADKRSRCDELLLYPRKVGENSCLLVKSVETFLASLAARCNLFSARPKHRYNSAALLAMVPNEEEYKAARGSLQYQTSTRSVRALSGRQPVVDLTKDSERGVEYNRNVKTIDINFLEPFHNVEMSLWLPNCLRNNDLQTILRNIPVYGELYATRGKIIDMLENNYSRFFTVDVKTEVGGVLITAHNEHRDTYFEAEWKIIKYHRHQSLCNSLFFSADVVLVTLQSNGALNEQGERLLVLIAPPNHGPTLTGYVALHSGIGIHPKATLLSCTHLVIIFCEDAFESLVEDSAATFESLMANWETIVKVVSGASSDSTCIQSGPCWLQTRHKFIGWFGYGPTDGLRCQWLTQSCARVADQCCWLVGGGTAAGGSGLPPRAAASGTPTAAVEGPWQTGVALGLELRASCSYWNLFLLLKAAMMGWTAPEASGEAETKMGRESRDSPHQLTGSLSLFPWVCSAILAHQNDAEYNLIPQPETQMVCWLKSGFPWRHSNSFDGWGLRGPTPKGAWGSCCQGQVTKSDRYLLEDFVREGAPFRSTAVGSGELMIPRGILVARQDSGK
ncbi:hypothetical protein PR048_017749 [Dryococelus australis]|uniref:Uncharacterized protein n=1 Tax=Dryococelus australis TaxID=614101 RepID=A0ABQ9HAZ0_9NEOP|nr:hypothetical protein PR048_017749 [Dryococelus australis]